MKSTRLCKKHLAAYRAGELFIPRPAASPATYDEILAVMRSVGRQPPEFCGVPNCARPHRKVNVCQAHFSRVHAYYRRHNLPFPKFREDFRFDVPSVLPYVQPRRDKDITVAQKRCHVPNCVGKYMGRGLCTKHYNRWIKERV